MTTVNSFKFGSIVLDGKKYSRDVFLYPDGGIRKRKGGFWKFGSHAIKREEIEELVNTAPDILIVGTGTDGAAKLNPDAGAFLKGSEVESVVVPSQEAVERFNELSSQGKRPAALIHITC
ncbi:MAG: hypothetical protein JSV77_03820 [Dehalococcoidales bacterium]|nr:MAG: hypothetical protein JSV77_03820 [Dehalococcoidales bacterium]